MDKNVIGGADGGRAGLGSQSPLGQTESVNDAVVSGQVDGLSREVSMGGRSGVQSPREGRGTAGSDVGGSAHGEVSKGRISRGYEPASDRTDSRTGEGPQYVWQPDLPLDPTHKRRPARGQGKPEQHSRLQTELLEAIFSSTYGGTSSSCV